MSSITPSSAGLPPSAPPFAAFDVIMDLSNAPVHAYHPGNVTFQQLCTNLAPSYSRATTKSAKLIIVQQVQRVVTDGGSRFLVLSPNNTYVQVKAQAQIRAYITHRLQQATNLYRYQGMPVAMSVIDASSMNNSTAALGAVDPQGGKAEETSSAATPTRTMAKTSVPPNTSKVNARSSVKAAAPTSSTNTVPIFPWSAESAALAASLPSTHQQPRFVQRHRLLHGKDGAMDLNHAAKICVGDHRNGGKGTDVDFITSLSEGKQNALAEQKLKELTEEKKQLTSWAKQHVEAFMLRTAKDMKLQVKMNNGTTKLVTCFKDIIESWISDSSKENQDKLYHIVHGALREWTNNDVATTSRSGPSLFGEIIEHHYMEEHNLVYSDDTALDARKPSQSRLVPKTATTGGYVHNIVMATINRIQQVIKTAGARKHGIWIGAHNEREENYLERERKRGKRATEGESEVRSPTPKKKAKTTTSRPKSQKKAALKSKPAVSPMPTTINSPLPTAEPSSSFLPTRCPVAMATINLSAARKISAGVRDVEYGAMEIPVPSVPNPLAEKPAPDPETKLATPHQNTPAVPVEATVEESATRKRQEEFVNEIKGSKSFLSLDGIFLFILGCFVFALIVHHFLYAGNSSDALTDMDKDFISSVEESYQLTVPLASAESFGDVNVDPALHMGEDYFASVEESFQPAESLASAEPWRDINVDHLRDMGEYYVGDAKEAY